MERIDLIGRAGKPTSALIHLEGNLFKYILLTDFPYSVSSIDDKNYAFIDPSDGPLLGVGSVIEGRTVLSIKEDERGYIVDLSDTNQTN